MHYRTKELAKNLKKKVREYESLLISDPSSLRELYLSLANLYSDEPESLNSVTQNKSSEVIEERIKAAADQKDRYACLSNKYFYS